MDGGMDVWRDGRMDGHKNHHNAAGVGGDGDYDDRSCCCYLYDFRNHHQTFLWFSFIQLKKSSFFAHLLQAKLCHARQASSSNMMLMKMVVRVMC